MNQSIICSWQIKFEIDKDEITCYDILGVVSNECDNIGDCVWGELVDFYRISAESGHIWTGTSHKFPDNNGNHSICIKAGGYCQDRFRFNSSELTFKMSDEIIHGPMKLPAKDAWYPAVHFGYDEDGTSATLIQMTF